MILASNYSGTFLKIVQILGVPLAALVMLSFAKAQQSPPQDSAKQPQLKLQVVSLRKSYKIGERLVVRYRLTSLADGTLCFPVPAIEVSGSFQGYVALDAHPRTPVETERDHFIEGFWPRHPDEAELRDEIGDHWIRLGMSEPYLVAKPDKTYVLNAPGEWVLLATYHPPNLSARELELVKSMGCTPPEVSVQSVRVTITVVDPSR